MRRIEIFLIGAVVLSVSSEVQAGYQVNTLETTQCGLMTTTNLVVTKMETNATRVDMGPDLSMIILPAAAGQVRLFHNSKIYKWDAFVPTAETNSPGLLPVPVETRFDDHPARLYSYTNGLDHSRVWVAPSLRFFGSSTNGFRPGSSSADISRRTKPGFPFGDGAIIVGTEYEQVVSASLIGAASAAPEYTNLTLIQTAKLLSVAVTNFPASDFQIPTNYVAGEPPLPEAPNPAQIGRGPTGQGNLEVLRKQYEKGAPVISWPAGMGNPK